MRRREYLDSEQIATDVVSDTNFPHYWMTDAISLGQPARKRSLKSEYRNSAVDCLILGSRTTVPATLSEPRLADDVPVAKMSHRSERLTTSPLWPLASVSDLEPRLNRSGAVAPFFRCTSFGKTLRLNICRRVARQSPSLAWRLARTDTSIVSRTSDNFLREAPRRGERLVCGRWFTSAA